MFLLLALVPRCSPAEFISQTFTNRRSLLDSGSFHGCSFIGCRAASGQSQGGALYVSNQAYGVSIGGCVFADCWASSEGGALYLTELTTFSLTDSSGGACSADDRCAFCNVIITSSVTGSVDIRDASTFTCAGGSDTLCVGCDTYAGGNSTRVLGLNSTANHASVAGSGLDFYGHFKVSFRFSLLRGNGPFSCLLFGHVSGGESVCLALLNNSCAPSESGPGLIRVWDSAVVLTSSAFAGNVFDIFLGAFDADPGTVTFINCIFDVDAINATNGAQFAEVNCRFSADTASLPECRSSVQAAALLTGASEVSPTPQATPIGISQTGHDSLVLGVDDEVVMVVSEPPIFVLLPELADVEAIVYDSVGTPSGAFSSPTAVFFSELGGRISFRALNATTLQYFVIRTYVHCSRYWVSSAPVERWGATRTGGNFTLGNSQENCLFHISDNSTDVSGAYDTESGFDFLFYQYSGSASTIQFYTGNGTITATSDYVTAFRWTSDPGKVSNSFEVRLVSNRSSLPYSGCQGEGTAQAPILLPFEDEIAASPTVSPVPEVRPTGTNTPRPTENERLDRAVIAVISAAIAVVVVVIVVAVVVAVRTRLRRLPEETKQPLGGVDLYINQAQ